MLWFLAALLLALWILGIAFKITFGFIHLLLVAAVIVFLIGLFTRPARTTV